MISALSVQQMTLQHRLESILIAPTVRALEPIL